LKTFWSLAFGCVASHATLAGVKGTQDTHFLVALLREIDLMRDMGHINVDVLLDQKTVTLTEQ
jgi:hypothetical protein